MNIRLVRLSKEFISARGRTPAVRTIDLEIRESEFFVLLGPSGCGKSTVLNLIAGLEKPTGGEIWFDDRLVASAAERVFESPRDRNIAMVFQSYALYPHLSVFGNIAFPLEIAGEGKKRIAAAVERVASMLGLTELLAARPGELSGGQRQRVAIARALVRHPTVFLLDEPLSNLDAQLRASTRTELRSLQRRLGITTVYVTHDQVEAMSLGDRIAVLREGRLEQVGRPEELFEEPANTFVASFIASPPMNLLEIELFLEAGRWLLRIDDRELMVPDCMVDPFDELKPGAWILGIRPEHIRIHPVGAAAVLKERVEAVEPMGREVLFHFLVGSQKLMALTAEGHFAAACPGEVLALEPDLKRAHLFSRNGKRVVNRWRSSAV